MGEIWEERQTDEKGTETARAFEVFTQYLYLEKPRLSYPKFEKWLIERYQELPDTAIKPATKSNIEYWSKRWHWKDRCDSFDLQHIEKLRKDNKVLVDDAFGNQVRTLLEQIDDLDDERKSIKKSTLNKDKKVLSLRRNSENKAILMKELRLIMGMSTDNNKSVVEHNGLKRLADAFK
ncbi:hypothetical protein [uncultured Methanobrevibacter sp.]|uniref:hypothetical protein n=1 Tax=uncultured Methanobrevibacter sp. TaxID=253161 RepID=UPI0025FB19F0|nr:hypothetical protein [uncultured Methanobrevibacter sp.]